MKAYFTTEEEQARIKDICAYGEVEVTFFQFSDSMWEVITFKKDDISMDLTVPNTTDYNIELDFIRESGHWSNPVHLSINYETLNMFDFVYGKAKAAMIYLYNNRSVE